LRAVGMQAEPAAPSGDVVQTSLVPDA